ncbi:MAG: alpha/beta hydrolase [Candidatus Thiodiazotropha sp. (ex Codakia rugifera)]|nr:alpha/beta hydrolase [Candidatus Thiodiazotropha sp. (ex Codakia rugifera)]
MKRKTYRLLAVMFLPFNLLLLHACSSVDHSAYFKRYEEAYKAKVKYKTHHVQRDRLSIHVREYGAKSIRPTFIMMHGFPDSMHLYDRLVPVLAANRHVITFDFVGWGDSDKPDNHRYDVASLRRDLEAVIAHFRLKQVVPVVHDASGQPGIDWALDNPDKSAGLVLLNTYYSPMPTLRAPEAIDRFSTPGIRRDISVWATRHWDGLWLSGYEDQIAKFISTKELRRPFQKLLGHQSLQIRPAFYGLNRVLPNELEMRQDKTAQLKQFQAPVRILFGKDDPYLNTGVARDLHQIFPNSELFLVENAGHFVQIDKPEQVAGLLSDFPPFQHGETE